MNKNSDTRRRKRTLKKLQGPIRITAVRILFMINWMGKSTYKVIGLQLVK